MSKGKLKTPEERVRRLQEKLHRSAKREPARRFHQLYDKVASPRFLYVAWRRVAAKRIVDRGVLNLMKHRSSREP